MQLLTGHANPPILNQLDGQWCGRSLPPRKLLTTILWDPVTFPSSMAAREVCLIEPRFVRPAGRLFGRGGLQPDVEGEMFDARIF